MTYKSHNSRIPGQYAPSRLADQPNTWIIIGGESAQHPRGDFDTMLKSNKPNSILKNALRDEDCPRLINCTTQ